VDELLDILDESGLPTGQVVLKSEAHRLGLWHRCFHCWICGSDPGGSYLLLQRRAATKHTWPGYLDVTAAGHLAAGEKTLDGLREVEEELGLQIKPERLVPLGTRRVEQEIPGGCDRELHEVFLVFDVTPPGDLRLQKEEVEAVFRLDLDDRIVAKLQTQVNSDFVLYSPRAASTGWNWRGACRSSRLAARRHRRPKPYALGCISIRHHKM
jgi:isopentenyldiphosphate isomerase